MSSIDGSFLRSPIYAQLEFHWGLVGIQSGCWQREMTCTKKQTLWFWPNGFKKVLHPIHPIHIFFHSLKDNKYELIWAISFPCTNPVRWLWKLISRGAAFSCCRFSSIYTKCQVAPEGSKPIYSSVTIGSFMTMIMSNPPFKSIITSIIHFYKYVTFTYLTFTYESLNNLGLECRRMPYHPLY